MRGISKDGGRITKFKSGNQYIRISKLMQIWQPATFDFNSKW